jgi:hypothetical protein
MMAERELSDVEFLNLLVGEFGMLRSMELMGWCLYFEMVKGERTKREMREQLQAQGMHRATAYRALADLERLRLLLAKAEGRDPGPVEQLPRVVVAKTRRPA